MDRAFALSNECMRFKIYEFEYIKDYAFYCSRLVLWYCCLVIRWVMYYF